MAPEVRRFAENASGPYDAEQAEVFSIGVFMFIVMFQKTPFGLGATIEDPQFSMIIDEDFHGFFSSHGATAATHDIEGLSLIWECFKGVG